MMMMEKPTNQLQSQQQLQQQQQQHQAHVLFEFSPLDAREDIDDKTQRTYLNLKQMTANKSAKECHEIYLKYIASTPISTSTTTTTTNNSQHNIEELTMGLLVAILVESDGQQSKYYRDVVTFSKDSLNLFSTYLNIIIIERLSKLRDHSIKQIFWITQQLMKANIASSETICSALIRQTAGGDLSSKNLWLIENLLGLFIENRHWVVNQTTFMVPTIIYTFMRLISDHMGPAQAILRQKEIDFVIGLIREKFLDCMAIGRDFLRLLHNVIRIPEFEKLWHDIYNNPKSLHPTFQNPLQLLTNRTPRRLFQSRLTFEMERKISFLATSVKFGNQKKYQDWFHKQYLSTPESLSLRCDLIRYICTIIHPSNEVLCSDIIPRWAIIGWLLTTCNTNASATNSKLALFFDWLLYDAKVDNIMNIEPAILVMYYSMRSHPNVTASLLDFLCRIPTTFSPKLSEHIKAGIKKSLQQILEKRVIQSIAPLFDNPKHDPTLKALIRESFPEFCANTTVHVDNGISITPQMQPPPAQLNHPSPTTANNNNSNSNNNNNMPVVGVTTITAAKQPTEIIVLDHDKTNSPSEIQLLTNSTETVGNRLLQNQSELSTYNHPMQNRVNDDNSIIIHTDDNNKIDQASPSPSSPSSSTSSSSSSNSRDEAKAFSWNGTENANLSYSHKQQNHDSNKNRKSSISNSNASTTTTTNTNTTTSESVKNQIKGPPTNDNFTNDWNFISKSLRTDPGFSSASCDSLSNQDGLPIKVIYSFMAVQQLDFKETLNNFSEPVQNILEDLKAESCNDVRCSLMDKLISVVFDNSDSTSNTSMLKELAHCIAYLVVDDFSLRIFPSSSQDNESLEESIAKPFFVLCRSAFSISISKNNSGVRPMSLLTSMMKCLEATGFLVLYFLRVNSIVNGGGVANNYVEFCSSARRKLTKCLYDDLLKALTYDSEMFCFLLPSVFGEIAATGSFPVTGNIDLIRLVASAIDPVHLQELICLCLTGTAKVINKEDVMPLIESSLGWESWEQYCVWKLITAQTVPVENYISILPRLDSKTNPEAMSCILLNLQKVSEPTINMLQQLIDCDCKPNDPFISSIIRYWSMRTDLKDLAKMISSLFDSRPSSPQVKRKGQTKTSAKNSSTLSSRSEKILCHLDSIRQRAPKNKLLAQTEILEMLSQMEPLCNESQKKRFADLFSNRPKANKKQKT